jgi:hypothetical protein
VGLLAIDGPALGELVENDNVGGGDLSGLIVCGLGWLPYSLVNPDWGNWFGPITVRRATYYPAVSAAGASAFLALTTPVGFTPPPNLIPPPDAPVFTAPDAYTTPDLAAGFTMTVNAFVGHGQSHASTSWEVIDGDDGTTVLWSSEADPVNLLSIAVPAGEISYAPGAPGAHTLLLRATFNGTVSDSPATDQTVYRQIDPDSVVAPIVDYPRVNAYVEYTPTSRSALSRSSTATPRRATSPPTGS